MFLDRDGTVVVERGYLSDPAGVTLLPGAAAALRAVAEAGYALVLVTNQSGIGRGLYGEAEYRAVQDRLEELLGRQGVRLEGTYHCPHSPESGGPCACRKPAPGLFRRAARELGLDLSRSVLVGDRLRDVVPALELGARGLLVRTGYGREEESYAPAEIEVVDDLAAAAARILSAERPPTRG